MNPPHPHNPQWLLWQLIDSSLPVGGFAHSGGLEAAVQLGEVQFGEGGALGVEGFVAVHLRQYARSSAPFAMRAFDQPSEYCAIDRIYDAFLTSGVANRASRAQGQALIAVAAEVWPGERVAEARQAVREGTAFGHWAVYFGLVARELGLTRIETAAALLYIQTRGILSAAVRLNVIGPLESQRIQIRLGTSQAELVETAVRTAMDDAAQTAPIMDLIQSQHDRLYSRLFVS
ncbi:MAG: urease accessory protein UreF [Burkholderiales bacterium]|nr:urease accessory protein UreF [Phycisphaerae bacterium]